MNYWWVNQKQTYRHEVRPRGYLWSPQRNKNGARNQHYEYMREVAPQDVLFSFANGLIKAIGVAKSHAYPELKPQDFGKVGQNWSRDGWRVDVFFKELPASVRIRPRDYIDLLRPFLPDKYSPLRDDGNGKEFYLTLLNTQLAEALISVIGENAEAVIRDLQAELTDSRTSIGPNLRKLEREQIRRIRADSSIPATERRALVSARRGQGQFRKNVCSVEPKCRVTGVSQLEHLRASHCKPWRRSTNEERLDGNNGLMLTPNVDHLFDRGLISFSNSGDLLVSPVADLVSLMAMGVDPSALLNVGEFNAAQCVYLQYHREHVFLKVSRT